MDRPRDVRPRGLPRPKHRRRGFGAAPASRARPPRMPRPERDERRSLVSLCEPKGRETLDHEVGELDHEDRIGPGEDAGGADAHGEQAARGVGR